MAIMVFMIFAEAGLRYRNESTGRVAALKVRLPSIFLKPWGRPVYSLERVGWASLGSVLITSMVTAATNPTVSWPYDCSFMVLLLRPTFPGHPGTGSGAPNTLL